MSLRLDWATHEAAKYACENWHYSKCMPMGKQVKIGVWETGKFIGVVLIGRPAFPSIGKPFGLSQLEVVELTRIALKEHMSSVSKIMSIAIRMIKKQSPGLKLIVSMADPENGHHGGIYQASNWVYVGRSSSSKSLKLPSGKIVHERTANHLYGRSWRNMKGCQIIDHEAKHKYVYPLNQETKDVILKLSKPYPKRVGSRDNAASGFQSEEGGVTPTPTLQTT